MFYASCSLLSVSMMSVFMCNNIGYMWICIEFTTLCSAPVVMFDRTKNAIEAAWKYIIVCSVGLAFALLGTVLIFASSQVGQHHGSLVISELMQRASSLNPSYLRLGFLFMLLGYGTKAGMFPLHTWMPDA